MIKEGMWRNERNTNQCRKLLKNKKLGSNWNRGQEIKNRKIIDKVEHSSTEAISVHSEMME